ncbi:hypothetical protein Dvar_36030 [Desulfosarcina variabilis str. Montpellier]|uniref:hypothetical protein n=1 Tax=Desulfosarcina variabilis TaxID=2300 RepID=UPI003AFB78DD
MITQAMEKVIDLSRPVELNFDGRDYTSKQIYSVKDPEPGELTVHTLSGLTDYIMTNPDGLKVEDLTIHILNFDDVRLYSPLFGGFEQRKEYIRARLIMDDFPWGQYMSIESFNIKLQSMFIKDETVERILSIVGNIKDEKVVTVGDDGITQQVTAKAGIARVENINLPNPVTLTPYRTFLEAEQPASRFVFRMRSGNGDGELPTAALFEADGGRWKLQAIQNVKEWLHESVPAEIRIIA